MSIAFEAPFEISYLMHNEELITANKNFMKIGLTSGQIKNPYIFELTINNLGKRFNNEARIELIKDLAHLLCNSSLFLTTFTEMANEVVQPMFELADFYEDVNLRQIHKLLLFNLMKSNQPNVWNFVRGSPFYQLQLLNDLLDYCIINYLPLDDKLGSQRLMQYIRLVNASEDLILKDPNIFKSDEIKQTICKLLLLLNKADMLYISLPTTSLFDERSVLTFEREQAMKLHWNTLEKSDILREGGIIRILLKLILFSIKFDATTVSITFLKYLLFRDKNSKKIIKQIAKIEKGKVHNPKKGKKVKYNAFDVFLKRDPEKMKSYNSVCDFYLKKVIWNEHSLLDSCKINKSVQQFPKDRSIFEQRSFLFLFILSQLFQLAHFELLDIENYLQIEKIDIAKTKEFYLTKMKALSEKYNCIVKLISEILNNKEDIPTILKTDCDIFFDGKVTQYERHFIKGNDLKLGTIYSTLNSLIFDKETHKISHIFIEEEKKVDSIVLKDNYAATSEVPKNENKENEDIIKRQHIGLEKFRSNWKSFIDSVLESLKNPEANFSFLILLLSEKHISLIQPYLHFLTTHNFNTIDYLITNKLDLNKKSMALQRNENQEYTKFFKDFAERIRNRFCYLSVHFDKIGITHKF